MQNNKKKISKFSMKKVKYGFLPGKKGRIKGERKRFERLNGKIRDSQMAINQLIDI